LLIDVLLCRAHITVSHHGVALRSLPVQLLLVSLSVLLAHNNLIILDECVGLRESWVLSGVEIAFVLFRLTWGVLFFFDLAAQPVWPFFVDLALLLGHVVGGCVKSLLALGVTLLQFFRVELFLGWAHRIAVKVILS
jgi:hypothetical protein